MKIFFTVFSLLLTLVIFSQTAFAYRYVRPYFRKNGSYVSGHYRDTSNDGNYYNNANYLGMND